MASHKQETTNQAQPGPRTNLPKQTTQLTAPAQITGSVPPYGLGFNSCDTDMRGSLVRGSPGDMCNETSYARVGNG